MCESGASTGDLFAVAAAQRTWATLNPQAWNRSPLALEEYLASPFVAEPLRRLDCARPVSGAVAVVVSRPPTSSAGGAARPVRVIGSGGRYVARRRHGPGAGWRPTGARASFHCALERAERQVADLDVLQIYDPFTVVPLIMLEELGFAPPGQAGSFVADGQTGSGGTMPTNTGGGQLSGYYLQGATPLVEVITQLRGTAGARQVDSATTGAVVAIGGRLEHHSSLILEVVG
jgi:acetyl-CoA acetyltransferase